MQKYNKSETFSYSIGVYPTIELLKYRSKDVLKVVISTNSEYNSGVSQIISMCKKLSIEYIYDDRIITKLSKSENCYTIGIFRKYAQDINSRNHIVLVNPSDMGNLGTIIRCMRAFNFENLAIIRPSADIFDPKVIRASMGAIFGINFTFFNTLESYINSYPAHNQYFFTPKTPNTLDNTSFVQPLSLFFGEEGPGFINIPETAIAVKIDQSGQVDSLNLAVSAAIALHSVYKLVK